ncbi:MAG: lipolytic enzyme, G-D-S-L [Desulfovibrio sp.]|uniref:GDSL-type esterase/lipase family protein n=1 Tax=Desulfovibrio sp. TaxID=885 RepID=UPI00135E8958|nr:GDSL-type esterase/lipase family protein [Desulfovibrio sp.]MTJ92531.1 lipolytic enzyme, G-D-S-L [Desulfovibrio sp.]
MLHTTPAWFFFGDSLTQGVNDAVMPGGWVSRLAVLAHEAGLSPIPRATFYNLGARRHSTADLATRWRSELECRLIPGMVPRLVFCTGVVDMAAPGGGQPAQPQLAAALLDQLLAEAASVAPTLVISPPPVSDAAANARIGQLGKLQQQICAGRSVAFAQVYKILADTADYMDDLSDGLHPGAQGCTRMAQTLLAQECVRAFMCAAQ